MGKLFSQFTPEKWAQIRNHPYYAKVKGSLLERADKYLESDPPVLKYSDLHKYEATGDRSGYGGYQSNRLHRATTLFMAYMITEDEKYLTALADIMWSICDMESWTPPYHIKEEYPVDFRRTSLDLGSCIMGMQLAEMVYFIGDKLPDLVCRRMKANLRERIVDSYIKYRNDEYRWERNKNNWNAVCTGSIFATFLYLGATEELDKELPRMLKSIDDYLSGFRDDGCCIEGYGYWRYGFTYFCIFAQLLREYTDGKIDLFRDEKIHSIAKFQQNISLNANEAISYSDSRLTFEPPVGLSHFLKSVYDDVEIPSLEAEDHHENITRHLLWTNPEYKDCEFKPKGHIFKDCQWFVFHNDAYSMSTKAGHNHEMHNHNDVGSFIVSKNGKVTFCDPGLGRYDANYFKSDTRYDNVACSSRGHSVPIINGAYQSPGEKKSVIYDEGKDRYVYSMENAYDIPTLKSLRRGVYCEEKGIRLVDKYEFDGMPESITERFVSLLPITIEQGKLIAGDSVLHFDPELFEVELKQEMIARHGNFDEPLYQADLTVKNLKPETELSFFID